MAVRREQVILDLTDNLTPGLARAAVAAKLLDRELKSMGGTSVSSSRNLDRTADSTDKVGNSSRRTGPEVDRMSGRLRILADAAFTLGPALIPLGAGTIPALTGALAGLGSAAGALGVTILAFKGLGAAIKSIDAYRLEPTAANLEKMRIEAEKLGPAGAEFAHYVANLEPQIRALQNTARAGLFPGVEDGIDAILTRAPEITKIINRLSQGMGDIARGAGMSLAGSDWDAFFKYIETDARPTLNAFATATGNVALGLANMMVAFAPLNRDFTAGLVDATDAFVKWSQGLDQNQGFQDFVAYVQESGPQLLDFLSALGGALIGLLQAAAPFGSVVLPALTGVAKVFATIAQSPIGPGLYAAAAGMIAFSRAADIASKTSTRFQTAWAGLSRARIASGVAGGLGLLALSLTNVDEQAGVANAGMGAMAGLLVGGPWGAAIGGGIGLAKDFADANAQIADSVDAANAAMRDGTLKQRREELQKISAQIADTRDRQRELNDLFTPNKSNLWADPVKALGGAMDVLTSRERRLMVAQAELQVSLSEGGDIADLFGETIGQTGNQLRTAAGDANAFSGALARLNGWFDKRDAIRAYKDAIDELRKSMKDGFTRDDAANLDNIGRSILQVAQNIKSPAARASFLEQARAQLVDMAEHSGPKAAAAIQEIIDKFDAKGLTHPKPIEITADNRRARHAVDEVQSDLDIMGRSVTQPTIDANDNPFRSIYGTVQSAMAQADRLRARPEISVDPGNSFGILDAIQAKLGGLHSKTISVTTINHSVGGGAVPPAQHADGGTIRGQRYPYRDKVLIYGAPGEEVISNRYGQADRHRALLKAISANRMAEGGTIAADTYTRRQGQSGGRDMATAVSVWVDGAFSWAKAVKALNAELDKAKKSLEKARQARDDAIARRDAISGDIQSGLAANQWADLPGSTNVWAAGATAAGPATAASATAALQASTARARRLVAAINTLKAKGITGPVLLDIIGTGDVERAEMMASLDIGTLSSFASAFGENRQALAAAGLAGGNAVEGDSIKATQRLLDKQIDELREIKRAIKEADEHNKAAQDKNAKDVKDGVNGAASAGHRRRR